MGDSPSILSDGRSEVMVQADSTTELVDRHLGDRPHPVSRLLRDLADWGMEETQALHPGGTHPGNNGLRGRPTRPGTR